MHPGLRARRRRGFALIVTIVLVAFLVLLLVGLATFTRVETQVAANSQDLAKARQNALFALNLALGELQRSAGPDQRVTATATLGENNPRNDTATYGLVVPQNGSRHWAGVWGGYRDDNFHTHRPALLNWLVSGNESALFTAETTNATRLGEITANPGGTAPVASVTGILGTPEAVPDSGGAITFNPATLIAAEAAVLTTTSSATDPFTIGGQRAALLVGPNTVGNNVADYVLAPTLSIRSTAVAGLDPAAAPDPAGYEVGRYAWWVGDEGVKARADLVDTRRASSDTTLRRNRSQVAPRFGVESVTGLSAYSQDPATGTGPAGAVAIEQLSLITGLAANDVKARFHDLTTHSVGVLADVAKGGLKKDLTAGLLASSASAPVGLRDSDEIFADLLPGSPLPGTRPARLPSWAALRSYVNLPTDLSISGANPSVSPRSATDTRVGIHPVVLRFHLWIAPSADTASPAAINRLDAVYMPAVVLWNPYDVTLSPQSYGLWFGLRAEPGAAYNFAHASRFPIVGLATKPATPAAPTPATPYTAAYYGVGNLPVEGFGLRIDPVAIPPGEAIVFTLDENIEFAGSTASARTLKPGFRLNFLRDTGLVTVPDSVNHHGQRQSVTLSIPQNFQSDLELRLGDSFDGSGRPTGDLLQRVGGVRWASPLVTGANYYPNADPVSTPAITVAAGIDTAGAGGFPSGLHHRHNGSLAQRQTSIKRAPATTGDVLVLTPPSSADIAPFLSVGLFAIMDGSANETTTLTIANQTRQNGDVRSKWIANQNPAAPEHNLAANDIPGNANSQYWSTGLYGNHNSNAVFTTNQSGAVNQLQTFAANYDNLFIENDGGNNAYVGNTRTGASPTTRCILFHLPRREAPVLSLGALQHVNLHPATGQLTNDAGYSAAAMPAYAIGNSFADPRVAPAPGNRASTNSTHLRGFADWASATLNSDRSSRAFHFDLSYLVNQALWDRYYFSTIPTSGTPTFPLSNPRLLLHDRGGVGAAALAGELQDFDRAASRLLVAGSFNANSTSVEAWKALLSSTLGAPVLDSTDANVATSGQSAFPRLPYPNQGPVSGSAGLSSAAVHSGFRSLSATEIDALATEIVRSVKLHGPFPSMARLVNRYPAASVMRGLVGWADYMGPLQLAIDRSVNTTADNNTGGDLGVPPATQARINDHLAGATTKPAARNNSNAAALTTNYNPTAGLGIRSGTSIYANSPAGLSNAAAGAPGYLTQADLLQVLGPVLSVRSDTFRVRTYGEARDPLNDTVIGRAWCEAIIQRMPDFVDDTQAAHLWKDTAGTSIDVNTTNRTFGRRFRVVSFRWLSPTDI